jgi:hypothetical protein
MSVEYDSLSLHYLWVPARNLVSRDFVTNYPRGYLEVEVASLLPPSPSGKRDANEARRKGVDHLRDARVAETAAPCHFLQ